ILVLMASEHPLAPYDVVPWAKLAQYPQVMFKDGYGMQRLVQTQFQQQGLDLNAVMELNTLDAFRGVIRQGEMISLLPQGALVEAQTDPTLAIRPLAQLDPSSSDEDSLTRQVVMVTTQDRLLIPPIANFRELVRDSFQERRQKPSAAFASSLATSTAES
ncbi:MAG: LysR family transcriptional regulator substrate-binding protein, partial [Thermosynechococcaceae cyanobacterium]